MNLVDCYEDIFGCKSERKAYKFTSIQEAAKAGLDINSKHYIEEWTALNSPHIFILAETVTEQQHGKVIELYDDLGYGHLLMIYHDEIQIDRRGEFVMSNDMKYVGVGPYYHCQSQSRLYMHCGK